MKIYSVYDQAFRPYGRVLEGYDTQALVESLEKNTPLPNEVVYVPSEAALESLGAMAEIRDNIYGGMPIQLGWCNGHNTKLNCLEYHRDSEVNLGSCDFILLLALRTDLHDQTLDTQTVRAFHCPAGVMVEIFATTLHYAPCHTADSQGFKVMVALPRGTNAPKPSIVEKSGEDRLLWAKNKWLLAHAESSEASQGACVGLNGINIDIANAT